MTREIRIAGDDTGTVVSFASGMSGTTASGETSDESSPLDVIDKPVAVVTYINTEVIGLYWFKEQVRKLELRLDKPASIEDRRTLLDGIIRERVLVQAALSSGITVSENETQAALMQFKLPYERDFGRDISFEELEAAVEAEKETTGLGWDDLVGELEDKILTDKYVRSVEKLEQGKPTVPGEDAVEKYYSDNRSMFVSQETVRFNHVFCLTKGLSAGEKALYGKRMEEAVEELGKKGGFEKYGNVYLPGREGAIGTLSVSVWRRDNEDVRFTYGDALFDAVFGLEPGVVSGVLESNLGFHIVQVTARFPYKILSLDDRIPPDNLVTVREYIGEILSRISFRETEKDARDVVIENLMRQSAVKIYEENLRY